MKDIVVAVVLMNIERAKIEEVAQQLIALEGVAEVYSVAGQYDLVVILRTQTNEQIANLMANRIRNIPSITRTETLIAFKAYSRDDLGAMFSIGNEEVKR